MWDCEYIDLDDYDEVESEDIMLTSVDKVTILFALLVLLGIVIVVSSPSD